MKKWLASILFVSLLSIGTPAMGLESQSVSIPLKTGKKSVTYISFHPNENLRLKPVLAQNKVGFTEELSSMAKRTQAIGAINGTFFNPYDPEDLQPLGAVMINHQLEHFRGSPISVGIKEDRTLSFFPTESIHIRGGINGSKEWPNNWYAWFINHAPSTADEIVLFTPSFKTSKLSYPNFTYVVVDQGKVTSISPHKADIPAKGFVIAYGNHPQNKDHLARFKMGDAVEYWLESDNLVNTRGLISAGPKLVTNGKLAVDLTGFTEQKITSNVGQRSFIGKKQDETIVMGTASNATMRDLAEISLKLGLHEAMNLDGGASSGLYFNGKYATKPGRPLSNSLVLIKEKAAPPRPIQVKVDGQLQAYDQPPVMINNRTLVPLRGIFEALGASVVWDAATQTVTATKGETTIALQRGSKEPLINGKVNPIDIPADIMNGRMMVPARFVSESLGAKVNWDAKAYTVIIETSGR